MVFFPGVRLRTRLRAVVGEAVRLARLPVKSNRVPHQKIDNRHAQQ
jgi:hypothetical protein